MVHARRPLGANPPESLIVYSKPDDLYAAKSKRGESYVEDCNYDDVQISKMSCA